MTATTTTIRTRSTPKLSAADLGRLNTRFESAHPTAVILWAIGEYGQDLALATSFSDTLLVDLALSVNPDMEVVFLDTGFHFSETLEVLKQAQVRYEMNLRVEQPDPTGEDLWASGTDACCAARKIRTLDSALAGKSAWLSGLRRTDSSDRKRTPIIEIDRRGLIKVNPIAAWPADEVAAYMDERDVIVNPLTLEGYPSIGCWPCTERTSTGNDARSGRWPGSPKTECGIHL